VSRFHRHLLGHSSCSWRLVQVFVRPSPVACHPAPSVKVVVVAMLERGEDRATFRRYQCGCEREQKGTKPAALRRAIIMCE